MDPLAMLHDKEQMRLIEWVRNTQTQMQATARGSRLELSMIDVIGEYFDWTTMKPAGVSAKWLKRELEEAGSVEDIHVVLSSPGGYYSEGIAIANLLKRHPARVTVEIIGEAMSAATMLPCIADHVAMHEGTRMMIHPAWTRACGGEADFAAAISSVKSASQSAVDMYVTRTGKTNEEVTDAVNATTYFTAHDAVEWGLADEVIPARQRATDEQSGDQPSEPMASPPAPATPFVRPATNSTRGSRELLANRTIAAFGDL